MRHRPGPPRRRRAAGGGLRGHAAVALANAAQLAATARRAADVQEAMRSRAVVEQARGVLMAVHQVDADEALARLSAASHRSGTPLRDVAADLVARVQGAGRTPGTSR